MINEEKKELKGREEKIMNVEKKIDFILQVYKSIQNLISFADTKANISLSIQSLLISIGLGSSLLANTFEHVQKLDDDNLSRVFYFIIVGIFIISSIVGIILSMLVYKARLPLEKTEQKREGLLYFGHIAQFPKFDDYYSKVDGIDDDGILRDLAQQVYHLSHITKKKMKYVNISLYFLVFNVCITITLIILSGYIITH
jgi:hypothetical protein